MCVSRSFSQYGVLGICTFDTFYHGYFPGAGLPFLFSFGYIPFYITFHSQKSTPHAFARRGHSCPLSCLPPASHCSRNRRLTDALRKAGCRTSGHDPPRRAFWPAIGSFLPLQCQAGVAGLPTSCRHYGENMPACALRTRPSEARRFVFYFSLLLLAEVTIIFRRKDSMRSGAA